MSKLKWDNGMREEDLSPEFKEFHAEERGVSGNVRLCREDGKAYLYWNKIKDHVDMGWAVGFISRIAGKTDEEAYDMLRLEKELKKVKVIRKDVNSW